MGSSIPYAVSKAAVNHLTRLLAKIAAPVRVNAVAPGLVQTPWTKDWGPLHEAVARQAPLARSATAEDIADAILGVVHARYMTGEIVLVDGGLSLVT
jgi:ketoreductase RED2